MEGMAGPTGSSSAERARAAIRRLVRAVEVTDATSFTQDPCTQDPCTRELGGERWDDVWRTDRLPVCYPRSVSPRAVKKAAVRRAEIIDRASDLFSTKGYAGTTVADILESVGMAKGGFYHHFASKQDVFEACADRLATDLAKLFVAALQDSSVTPRERVAGYLRLGYSGADQIGRQATAHDLHSHGGHDLHARVIDRVQDQVAAALAQAVADGRDRGDYSFEGEPEVVAVAAIGLLRALHERYADDPDAMERVPPAFALGLVERVLGAPAFEWAAR